MNIKKTISITLIKKTISIILSALMLAGTTIPALAANNGESTVPDNFSTVDYVEDMIHGLDGLPTDENGIPAVIASNPMVISQAPADYYTMEINGEVTDIQASVMVPLHSMAEKLGFTVTGHGEDCSITLDNGKIHTTIRLNDPMFQIITSIEGAVGATGPLDMGMAPYCVNGVTYVPLKLFNALLGNGAITLEGSKIVVNTKVEETLMSGDPSVALISPFVDCNTLAEAEKLTGFSIVAPKGWNLVQAWSNHLIQLFYGDNGKDMLIRKAVSSDDVSGDYNEYAKVKTVNGVTLKGENDCFTLAIWTKDGYTYSVNVTQALPQAELLSLVASIA